MKKKQPTVADVLHLAADKYLAAHDRFEGGGKERFSCLAVAEAAYELEGNYDSSFRQRLMDGLRSMGCDTSSSDLFKKYGDDPDHFSDIDHRVQGMRYMWLKWAALMAEEQGV
jgi:hypothetical protein